MGKDLNGKELGVGVRQRTNGYYDARAFVNGIQVYCYNESLKQLRLDFEMQKNRADKIGVAMSRKATLNQWFNVWFETYKAPTVKDSSIVPMRNKFVGNYGALIGDMELMKITNIDIQNATNTLVEWGRATTSIREAWGRLRDCLDAAVRNSLISQNPAYEVILPRNRRIVEDTRFLTADEQKEFIDVANQGFYKELFNIMILSGLRVGEIGALKWETVDFKKKCFKVNSTLMCQYENGVKTLKITEPKTPNSHRSIPFFGNMEELFLSQKKKQDKLKEQLGDRYRSKDEFFDCVFMTGMGSVVTRYTAEKEINKIVEQINLDKQFVADKTGVMPELMERVTPHSLRRTCATRLFEAGITPKVIQKILGHCSLETTMNIYVKVADDLMMNELKKLG